MHQLVLKFLVITVQISEMWDERYYYVITVNVQLL